MLMTVRSCQVPGSGSGRQPGSVFMIDECSGFDFETDAWRRGLLNMSTSHSDLRTGEPYFLLLFGRAAGQHARGSAGYY